MKHTTLRTAGLLLAALFTVATPAIAKTTGTVTGVMHFREYGIKSTYAISAAEGIPGSGTLSYSDEEGNWYTVALDYVRTDGDTAWVGGHLTGRSDSYGFLDLEPWLHARFTEGSAGMPNSTWGVFTSSQLTTLNWVVNEGIIYPGNDPVYATGGSLLIQ